MCRAEETIVKLVFALDMFIVTQIIIYIFIKRLALGRKGIIMNE